MKETEKASAAVEKRRSESRPENAFQLPRWSQLWPHKPLHSSYRSSNLLPEALFPGELVAPEKHLSLLQILSTAVPVAATASENELLTHIQWRLRNGYFFFFLGIVMFPSKFGNGALKVKGLLNANAVALVFCFYHVLRTVFFIGANVCVFTSLSLLSSLIHPKVWWDFNLTFPPLTNNIPLSIY